MNRTTCHFEKLVGMVANGLGLGDGLEFETRQPVTEAKFITKS